MPNPYDTAFRERVVVAYEAGRGSYRELAAMFGLGPRTVERWVARWRTTGSVAAAARGGGWVSPIARDVLEAVVAEAPDATCAEVCWAYNRRVPAAQRSTLTSVWRALRRAGYVSKKGSMSR